MDITIRPACKEDYDIVPELMLQAMEEIVFTFIEKQDIEEAIQFLTVLFKEKNNLYSYENTFVAVNKDQEVLGCITGYDGAKFEALRQPVLEHMKQKYNNDYVPEAETAEDQFYIDTVAVSVLAQGQGIGAKLLNFIVEHAKANGHQKVGLIVDLDNPQAMKLYQKLGFKQGEIIEFAQKEYYNMYI
ncbi:N-acetyltransferase family protein [Myroides sp. LJL115]